MRRSWPETLSYNVHMSVTRRELALIAAAAALPAAKAEPQEGTEEETRSAHATLRRNAEQIDRIDVPVAVEPAFHFKA